MITAVTDALTTVIGWIGSVVTSLVTGGTTPGALNALLPIFAIGIAISVILLAVRVVRSIAWGA